MTEVNTEYSTVVAPTTIKEFLFGDTMLHLVSCSSVLGIHIKKPYKYMENSPLILGELISFPTLSY